MTTLVDRIDPRIKKVLKKKYQSSLEFLESQKDEIELNVRNSPDTAYFLLEGLALPQSNPERISQYRSRILLYEGSALKELCFDSAELTGKPFQRLLWWKDTEKLNNAFLACAYDSSKEGFVWSGPIRTKKPKARLRHYFLTTKINHEKSPQSCDSAIVYLKRQEREYLTISSTRPAEPTELPAEVASGSEETFTNWMRLILKDARKNNRPYIISLRQIKNIPTDNLLNLLHALRILDKNYDIKVIGVKNLPDDQYMLMHLAIGKNYFIPPENFGFKRLEYLPDSCAHEKCWEK